MLRFRNADLRPVITEALQNKCKLVLVKDQGVYFMSERGERTPEGRQKLIAYAVGCNPDVDAYENWWELARAEFGDTAFAEYIDPANLVFERALNSQDDIQVKATEKHLTIEVFPVNET